MEASLRQPEMVGRERELEKLTKHLDDALEGEGSTVFISGEAGIGKTRLVEELKKVAQSKGFLVLSGYSMYESLTPYMPFFEALKSGGLEALFAEETPRVEGVYLVTNTGLLVKEVVREETSLEPNIFASMLRTVDDFIEASFTLLGKAEERGGLNRLSRGDYTILVERGENAGLVTVVTGKENEFLINDMREILTKVHNFCGNALKDWDGEEDSVHGVDRLLQPFITSGKYDGVYYGKEDPKARRNLLFEHVSLGLFRRAQITPSLLCIEDLQWADPSTLALLHYVSRNTTECDLLIICTYRPEDIAESDGKVHPLTDAMQRMGREDLYGILELRRLPKEETIQVVSSILGECVFDQESENRIHHETGGNPLFILELVRMMVEDGILGLVSGEWRVAKELSEIDIPSKAYDVIVRRLNRVKEGQREILDCASVIGEEFTSELASSVLGIGRLKLLEALRRLEQRHKLINSHNGDYKFDHPKIKEVTYSEIPLELRTEYHSIIADSIEKLHKDDLDDVIGDLAFHCYQCKNKEKALLYLTMAAEKAKKDYSNEEAIRFYNQALEFEGDSKMRMKILESLGDIHCLVGDYDTSVQSYHSAFELAERKREKAEIGSKIGSIYKEKGEYDNALRFCKEALNFVRDRDCREKAGVLSCTGSVYRFMGESDKALEHFERSLAIFADFGDQAGIARSLHNVAMVLFRQGHWERALENLFRCVEISDKIGHQNFLSNHFNSIGVIHNNLGNYPQAREYFDKCRVIKERMGDAKAVGGVLNNIGLSYGYQGDFEVALEYYKASARVMERIEDQEFLVANLLNVGHIYRLLGDYDRSLQSFEKALGISERFPNQERVVELLGSLGCVHRDLGNTDKALKFHRKSLDVSERIGLKIGVAENLSSMGDAHTDRMEFEEALHHYERSLTILDDLGAKDLMSRCHNGIATVSLQKGELKEALAHSNKASALSNETGSKEELARAMRILGMIHRESRNWKEASESLSESVKILEKTQIRKALGESHYEYGLLWKAIGDTTKAMKHLGIAVDLFDKMRLEHLFDKSRDAYESVITEQSTEVLKER